ncbi:MAG: hypothetical protein HC771_23845 [Synechococcales cyanobacterium CRU_2_2]|nr:hypothetical protein [Synechococcales cyanobacterium CRU_2_2]
MITIACVSEVFLVLSRWAGREPLHPDFLRENYDFLKTKGLTDQQLRAAAAEWRCKSRFFPCAQDLLDQVFLASQDRALMEWTAIALAPSGTPVDGLTDVGRKALAAIGGRWAVDSQPTGIMRKQFLEVYLAIASQKSAKQLQQRAKHLQAQEGGMLPPGSVIDISSIGGDL